MQKQGFTLIELIGSVVILAIVALIAFPSIINVLKTSQNKVDNSTKQLVEVAACKYVNEHKDDYKYPKWNNLTEGDTRTQPVGSIISVTTLYTYGYLEDSFYQKNKKLIEGGSVKVSVVGKGVENKITGQIETFYRYKCKYQ